VKRSGLGTYQYIWGNANSSAENGFMLRFENTDTIRIADWTNTAVWQKITTQVFRDVSAWYHIVVSYDTTNGTAADRVRFYVNGSRVTTFSTNTDPTQNYDGYTNNTSATSIGRWGAQADYYFSGLLADIHFCDGTAYDASAFGEFDANGIWQPKKFAGVYGTNGFKLSFSDNSTAAALGTDSSGQGNTWTVNNLSVTAGAGNDSLVDVPTNGSEVDTGSGGQVRGNYATWNPLKLNTNGSLANGNLDWSSSSTGGLTVGTIGVSSGKWYWEVTITSGTNCGVGVFDPSAALTTYSSDSAKGIGYYGSSGSIFYSGGSTSYGNTFTTGDTIGVALDLDNGKIYFSKNGTWQNSGNPATQTNPARTGLSGTYAPEIDGGASNAHSASLNAGARSFAYTAPSGFRALCTANLPAPVVTKPSDVMDVKLYTGNGSTQTVSGLLFSPDLVWIKCRSSAEGHSLHDAVRGATSYLQSNNTNAEATSSNTISAFTSDGFSVGSSSNTNLSSATFAAWTWDAGSSTVTNTQGSISSQVRANPSAGFSVVTYTGSSSNFTVGHGLGVEPRLILIKNRSASANWFALTKATGSWLYGFLNATDALNSAAQSANSSTIDLVNAAYNWFNANGDNFVAYCFAPVAGYSSFGSYTGNGQSGDSAPFVWTGFRPRWILVKPNASSTSWLLHDTARNPYNASVLELQPNDSLAEYSTVGVGAGERYDILSNGFKLRSSNNGANQNGVQYIYACFAESPFQYARAR
jgi:hypothetical protein